MLHTITHCLVITLFDLLYFVRFDVMLLLEQRCEHFILRDKVKASIG